MVPNELGLLAKEKVRLLVERAEDFAESFGESLLEKKKERLLSHNQELEFVVLRDLSLFTSYLEHNEKILALHLQMPRIAKCSR